MSNDINDIRERTVRIETKLDAYIEEQKEIRSRVKSVEKQVWYATGAVTALIFAWDNIKGWFHRP